MQYRGYTYSTWEDDDGDVVKIFHEIIRPDGKEVLWELVPREFRNLSPYRLATLQQFQKAVDEVMFLEFSLGKPNVVNNIQQGERI